MKDIILSVGSLYLVMFVFASCQMNSYIDQSVSSASRAGWAWVGCDKATIAGIPWRVTCLVKDSDGKVIDIDNIRSD